MLVSAGRLFFFFLLLWHCATFHDIRLYRGLFLSAFLARQFHDPGLKIDTGLL